jgi:hypothetical protein
VQPGDIALGAPFTAPIRPFFTSATDCDFDNGGQRIRIDSYQNPDDFTGVQEDSHPLNVTGCEDPRFRFEPEISLQPSTEDAERINGPRREPRGPAARRRGRRTRKTSMRRPATSRALRRRR